MFVFALLKLILNFFSVALTLPLISSAGLSHNTKKLFLRLPTFDDELLSIPKITSFLVKLLLKFNETAPSNITLQTLYTYLFLTLFFTILVVPNKQFFNVKLLRRLFSSHLNRRQCKHIQLQSRNCFSLQLKCSS